MENLIKILQALEAYLLDPDYNPTITVYKDRCTINLTNGDLKGTFLYVFGTTQTPQDALDGFRLQPKEADKNRKTLTGLIDFLKTYGMSSLRVVTFEYTDSLFLTNFAVSRNGTDAIVSVFEKDSSVKVYYKGLMLKYSDSYDFGVVGYVGRFTRQLASPQCLSGCSDVYSIIRCLDVIENLNKTILKQKYRFDLAIKEGFGSIHAMQLTDKGVEKLCSIMPLNYGYVDIVSEADSMTVPPMMAFQVLTDFDDMMKYLRTIPILGGDLKKEMVFKHFYELRALLAARYKNTIESVFLGDYQSIPYIVIKGLFIRADLYTDCLYIGKVTPENEPLDTTVQTLRIGDYSVLHSMIEQMSAINNLSSPASEEIRNDNKEEDSDSEEREEDTSEDDDWDHSDDSEEEYASVSVADDEEEEEPSEDSEDDEEWDSDDDLEGDDEDDGDEEEPYEEATGTECKVSLSDLCRAMFTRVLNMFSGQPSSRLDICDKGDKVIVSWPGSPCPLNITLIGYPKDENAPAGPWLWEAEAQFQDRTFNTNPQTLIECVNDYKETLASLTSQK